MACSELGRSKVILQEVVHLKLSLLNHLGDGKYVQSASKSAKSIYKKASNHQTYSTVLVQTIL